MSLQAKYAVVKTLQGLAQSWFATSYVLFVLSYGHELWQVNLLNVVFMGTVFLVDPITGAIGDRWGYRKIYLVGCLLWALADLLYFATGSYIVFLLAEFVAALGYAAESEALESKLDNELPASDAAHARGMAESGRYLAGIFGGVLGGFFAGQFGLQWPWLLAAVTHLAVFVATLVWFPADVVKKKSEVSANFWAHLAEGARFTFSTKEVLFVTILGFATSAAFQPLNMFWAPRLTELGAEQWQLGFVWAGISGFLSLGAWVSRRFVEADKSGFVKLLVFTLTAVVAGALCENYLLVGLFFVIHEIPRGAWRNAAYAYVNKHIPSGMKSTVNSFRSAAGAACGLLLSGWLSTFLPVASVWLLSAACLALLAVWILLRRD